MSKVIAALSRAAAGGKDVQIHGGQLERTRATESPSGVIHVEYTVRK